MNFQPGSLRQRLLAALTVSALAAGGFVAASPALAAPPHAEPAAGGASSAGAPTPTAIEKPDVMPGIITLSGIPRVGEPVAVNPGTWNPSNVTLRYTWQRDGVLINGATGASYTPVPEDAGTQLTATVYGTASGYNPGDAMTDPATVATGRLSGTAPSVDGSAQVGAWAWAGVVPANWGPGSVSFGYQWLLDGSPISGATGSSYMPTGGQADHELSLAVTGSRTGYQPLTLTSARIRIKFGELQRISDPTISGGTKVGDLLTATPGAYAPELDFFRSYRWMRDGQPIPGADQPGYRLTSADAGTQVHVVIDTMYAGYGLATAASAGVLVQPGSGDPGPLLELSPGEPKLLAASYAHVGSPVSVDPGTWGPGEVAFAYQWLRDNAPIPGATGQFYTPTAADLGDSETHQLSVAVTGSKPGYASATRLSTVKQIHFGQMQKVTDPTLTGTAKVGAVLTAHTGQYQPAAAELRYAWFRDGRQIGGAEGQNYRLVAADAGTRINAVVIGLRPGYENSDAATAQMLVAAADPADPSFDTAPAPIIAGVARAGARLTARVAGWAPAPDSFNYSWLRDGLPIDGASGASHVLSAADRGHRISVEVTGSRAGYASLTKTSAPLFIPRVIGTATPRISGTPKVGKKLTVRKGAWKPAGLSYRYQWKRNGTAIRGSAAKKASYRLTKKDRGARITVVVTAKKTGYLTAVRTSKAVRVR